MASKSYRRDYDLVKKVVYATHGGTNPYENGSRKHRLYEKINRHYHDMESICDDMEVLYGSIGIKKYPEPMKPSTIDTTLKD